MPIHDWTRVDAGLFHAFHHDWITSLSRALNEGRLPSGYYALPEQRIGWLVPDVLTPDLAPTTGESDGPGIALAVATTPPRTQIVRHAEEQVYVRKANRIAVHHRHGEIVAVIEIVLPGNKATYHERRRFVDKSAELIRQGIHLLVIDLFPPGKRDPQGIHKAIWDEIVEEEFELPSDKPLTLASYDAGPPEAAYVEPVGVCDVLPDMPIFLKPELYVPAPLEVTYLSTWRYFPAAMKRLLEAPKPRPLES
jgi:hypothetical protein